MTGLDDGLIAQARAHEDARRAAQNLDAAAQRRAEAHARWRALLDGPTRPGLVLALRQARREVDRAEIAVRVAEEDARHAAAALASMMEAG